jgi:hypothetical protein
VPPSYGSTGFNFYCTALPQFAVHAARRDVAVHVAFESKGLKPGFRLTGARVETTWVPGAFQLWVRRSQPVKPHHEHRLDAAAVHPVRLEARLCARSNEQTEEVRNNE